MGVIVSNMLGYCVLGRHTDLKAMILPCICFPAAETLPVSIFRYSMAKRPQSMPVQFGEHAASSEVDNVL